jgi:hypothetical protein
MKTGGREKALSKGSSKGSKIIKCNKHGLVYDLNSSTGCALCKRERKELDRESQKGAKMLLAALTVVLAATVSYVYVSQRGGNDMPNDSIKPASRPKPRVSEEQKEQRAVLAIGNLIDRVSNMVDNAELDMQGFGQARVDLRNLKEGDNEARLNNWRFWIEDWLKKVGALQGENIDRRVYIPQKQSGAFRSIRYAISRMKQVPNPGPGVSLRPGEDGFKDYYLPDENVRTAWLKEIHRSLDQAAAQLK